MSFLELARRVQGVAEEPTRPVVDGPLLATRDRLAAVLVASPRFGKVWIALDANAARELSAEESGLAAPRPVLLPEDVTRLRGKSDAAIRAALEVCRAFPGSRLVQ